MGFARGSLIVQGLYVLPRIEVNHVIAVIVDVSVVLLVREVGKRFLPIKIASADEFSVLIGFKIFHNVGGDNS